MMMMPLRAKQACRASDARVKVTGLGARKRCASWLPATANPRGLSTSDAILERYLLVDNPIDTVMLPMAVSTRMANQANDRVGKRLWAVETRGVPKIHKGCIDRERLDEWRQPLHQATQPAPNPHVFVPIRGNNHGMRASAARLEHRNGRANAEGARGIAGRRRDPARPAAADHQPIAPRRAIGFLHRGIERIGIDVGDRQVSMSARRARRGDPHVWPCLSRASARQSRRKPDIDWLLLGVASPDDRGLRESSGPRVAPGCTGQCVAGTRDIGRIDPGMRRKGK